ALARPEQVPELDKVRRLIGEVAIGARTLEETVDLQPLAADACARFASYSDRLGLVKGSSMTDLDALDDLCQWIGDSGGALVVDYLQKVPVHSPDLEEPERVTRVASALKDLAMRRSVPVVSLVAADTAGLTARRMRLQHLRGSTALAHEADVVIALNEKWTA